MSEPNASGSDAPDGLEGSLLSVVRRVVQRLVMWLLLGLHWAHCRWQLIRPAWFSILIVVLVAFAFLNPQTQDVLIAIRKDGVRIFMLFLGLLIFAFTTWYCARAILSVDYKLLTRDHSGRHQWCPPLEPKTAQAWRDHAPHFLGVTVPTFVGGVYVWHAVTLDTSAWSIILGLFTLGLVFLYLIFYGRHHIRKRENKGGPAAELSAKLLSRSFWMMFLLLGVVAFILALLVWVPHFFFSFAALPVWLGSPFLLLLAAAFWLAFVNLVLIYPTYRFRLTPPLVLLAVVYVAALNWLPWRENDHVVRTLEGDPKLAKEFTIWAKSRPDIQTQLGLWLAGRRPALAKASADRRYPVFVLTAEGGGIRAAYWTAAVLAEIEDRVPGFACHVFAISGVSGGSLGAAVYAGLIAEKARLGKLNCTRWYHPPAEPPQPWPSDGQTPDASNLLLSRATRTLGQDFLAPTLAGMLYPDLIQRLLPVSLLPDRAQYLEMAWEGAWAEAPRPQPEEPTNWLQAPFHELWDLGSAQLVPSVFLNTTEVETGRRLIVSNLRLPGRLCEGLEAASFGEVTDAFAPDCRQLAERRGEPQIAAPIPLSTAAGLSARFTYVSPPAKLHNGVRVVDGGYYENGGILTAHDILRELEAAPAYRAAEDKLRLVVIDLVNGTFEEELAEEEPPTRSWLARSFHETWAPVSAVLGTRTARGKQAFVDLKAALTDPPLELTARKAAAVHLNRLGLRPPGRRLCANRDPSNPSDKETKEVVATFPLGWMLAPSTVKEMGLQAKDAVAAAFSADGMWLTSYAWQPSATDATSSLSLHCRPLEAVRPAAGRLPPGQLS